MNSKLIKLDAPYNVIYAGGIIGRHIATLMVWNDDEDTAGCIQDAASYPVVDEGEEFPAGTLCEFAEIHDCRVLCPPGGTNLYWIGKMIEYDFQQLEPVGAEHILERMKLLGCKIVMPTSKDEKTGEELPIYDFEATLDVTCLRMPIDGESGIYRVRSNRFQGFYFQAEGTEKEIYRDLHYQLNVYKTYFPDLFTVCFSSLDGDLTKVANRLNADQRIEGYADDDNTDWY